MLDVLRTIELSPLTQRTLGFNIELDPPDCGTLIKQGLWWIQPLFGGFRNFGFALKPGLPLEDSPIVYYKEGTAVTAASSVRTALPMLLYYHTLAGLPDAWKRLRDRWSKVENDFRALEAALGGSGGVDRVVSLMESDDLIQAEDQDNPDELDRAAAQLEILQRLDPSPEHVAYRQWMDNLIREEPLEGCPVKDFGRWDRSALAAAFISRDLENNEFIADVIWGLLTGPASLDTNCDEPPEHIAYAAAIGAQSLLLEISYTLKRHPEMFAHKVYQSHPLWKGSVLIGQEGDNYTGLPHMEAATLLDKSGKPEQALDAVMSAAFWSFVRYGEAFPQAQEAALFMAERDGWTHISGRVGKLSQPDKG